MSSSPNRSPRGSTTNPTPVEIGNGHKGDEKKDKGSDSALETAVAGEAPEEGLSLSQQEKEKLDADPNVVDWEPKDPLYVQISELPERQSELPTGILKTGRTRRSGSQWDQSR